MELLTSKNTVNGCFRHCGIENPSWSELKHFVDFLNVQLSACENSVFCSDMLAPDLPGFVNFVIQFMIQMSKVRVSIFLDFTFSSQSHMFQHIYY